MVAKEKNRFYRETGNDPADANTVFCTANYANTEHNFVIQNLSPPSETLPDEYQAICIVRNIIQRGCPTRLSSFLQEKLGVDISDGSAFWDPLPLVSPEPVNWFSTIKGGDQDNPAELFFNKLLPKILKGAGFIRNLILPEASIEAITATKNSDFIDECVDFYLPHSRLVIEIDGGQHQSADQVSHDNLRKKYLERFQIKTIRLTTSQIRSQKLDYFINQLRYAYRNNNILYDAYKKTIDEPWTDVQKKIAQATAICRFQILILELLKRGRLRLDGSTWRFQVKSEDECDGWLHLAFEDLCIWFDKILRLQGKAFNKPTLKVQRIAPDASFLSFAKGNELFVDFSLRKRYSDENRYAKGILFVRGAYLPTDYYQVEMADLVDYPLTLKDENEMVLPTTKTKALSEDDILLFLFQELVVPQDAGKEPVDFRPGQLDIIKSALSRKATIGLLPTGSGKSACYQLAALLQPAPSMVVAPLISLMDDQVQELKQIRITRVETINSSTTKNKEEQRQALARFGRGGYFFIFISPERFQNQRFREQLLTIPAMAYAVIDEAHCLSEWGHDFRTSYLTLIQTIQRYCNPTIRYLALTATASFFVRKDIRVALSDPEHGLREEDVNLVSILNFSRKELTFRVIDTGTFPTPMQALEDTVQSIMDRDKTKAGNKPGTLIFTPYASNTHAKGAGRVKFLLAQHFEGNQEDFKSYSGQMEDDKKRDVHQRFKANEFRFLVSTKAFGMGVNKKNIRETIHFGIPGSFEGFYQEAGRAGRDGKPAQCSVFFTRESPKAINSLWGKHDDSQKSTARDTVLGLISAGALKNDIGTHLFLQKQNFQPVDRELAFIKYLYDFLVRKKQKLIAVDRLPDELFEESSPKKKTARRYDSQSTRLALTQKYLYRLYQLGIVLDWTVNHGFGQIEVLVHIPEGIDEIRNACESQIKKYDSEFSFNSQNPIYQKYIEILNGEGTAFERYARILLEWNYDNFVGYRLESLHNIYQACDTYVRRIENGGSEKQAQQAFKDTVEGFFAIDKNSLILQKLIDDQRNIELALSLLFEENPFAANEKRLKSSQDLKNINYQLMRVLEEYRHNCSFNLLAGMVRMTLDEYDDCWPRIETGLKALQGAENVKAQHLAIDTLLNLGSGKEDHVREGLSESILNSVPEENLIFKLYGTLNDEYSAYHVAKALNNQTQEMLASWGNGMKS